MGFPDWQQDAACKEHPQEWFFGEDEAEGLRRHRPTLTMPEVRRAKEVCYECPVVQDCFEYAMDNEERHGIWGGTTGRDRDKIRRELTKRAC